MVVILTDNTICIFEKKYACLILRSAELLHNASSLDIHVICFLILVVQYTVEKVYFCLFLPICSHKVLLKKETNFKLQSTCKNLNLVEIYWTKITI